MIFFFRETATFGPLYPAGVGEKRFNKSVDCFCQAMALYRKKVFSFLYDTSCVFINPLREFWKSRSVHLAVHCGKEAFHKAFERVCEVILFPILMIVGLFYPKIYQRIQKRLIGSLCLPVRFDEMKVADGKALIELTNRRGFFKTIFSKIPKQDFFNIPFFELNRLTNRDLDEVIDFMQTCDEETLESMGRVLRKIYLMDEKGVFIYHPERWVRAFRKIPVESRNVMYCLMDSLPLEEIEEILQFIEDCKEKKATHLDLVCKVYYGYKIPVSKKKLLKIFSRIPEEALQGTVFYMMRLSDKGFLIDELVDFILLRDREELVHIENILSVIEDLRLLYAVSSLGRLLHMFYKVPEKERLLFCFCMKLGALEYLEIDGVVRFLGFIEQCDQEELTNIAVILEGVFRIKRSFYTNVSAEELLSTLVRVQKEDIYFVIEYVKWLLEEHLKIEGILQFIKERAKGQLDHLGEILRIIQKEKLLDGSSQMTSGKLLNIFYKIPRNQIGEFCHILRNAFGLSIVKDIIKFVAGCDEEVLKDKVLGIHYVYVLKKYPTVQTPVGYLLKVFFKIPESQLERVAFALEDLAKISKMDDILHDLDNCDERDLRNIGKIMQAFSKIVLLNRDVSSACLWRVFLKVPEDQLSDFLFAIEDLAKGPEIHHILNDLDNCDERDLCNIGKILGLVCVSRLSSSMSLLASSECFVKVLLKIPKDQFEKVFWAIERLSSVCKIDVVLKHLEQGDAKDLTNIDKVLQDLYERRIKKIHFSEEEVLEDFLELQKKINREEGMDAKVCTFKERDHL